MRRKKIEIEKKEEKKIIVTRKKNNSVGILMKAAREKEIQNSTELINLCRFRKSIASVKTKSIVYKVAIGAVSADIQCVPMYVHKTLMAFSTADTIR